MEYRPLLEKRFIAFRSGEVALTHSINNYYRIALAAIQVLSKAKISAPASALNSMDWQIWRMRTPRHP
jgi:hypothetical protein